MAGAAESGRDAGGLPGGIYLRGGMERGGGVCQQSAASWNIESFTVGDVSVKTASGEKSTQQMPVQRLTTQAQLLMRPFCRAEDFAFVGVRG